MNNKLSALKLKANERHPMNTQYTLRFFSDIDGKLARVSYHASREAALGEAKQLSSVWSDYEIEAPY